MPNTKKISVVGFFHSWSWPERVLQFPYDKVVATFEALGIDLKIIWTNDLVSPDNVYAFSPLISEQNIIRTIQEVDPDFVISINNGGFSKKIRDAIKCPVIKWLFDDFSHLFFHHGHKRLDQVFSSDDIVVVNSSGLAVEIEQRYPNLKGKIYFIPPSTNINLYVKLPWKPITNVSFVGNLLDNGPITRMLALYNQHDPEVSLAIVNATEALRADHRQDFNKLLKYLHLDHMLEEQHMSEVHFKRVLMDVISNQERAEIITALKQQGLTLFGSSNWLDPLIFRESLAECYQAGVKTDTHQELAQIYQSSKITIVLPSTQNFDSISSQMIDVMASGSLLITKYQKNSDAFKLFGENPPILMYRDSNHLQELCAHYLSHENERIAAVKKCNSLVAENFALVDSVRQILSLVGKKVSPVSLSIPASFISEKKFAKPQFLRTIIQGVRDPISFVIGHFVPPRVLQKMINILSYSIQTNQRSVWNSCFFSVATRYSKKGLTMSESAFNQHSKELDEFLASKDDGVFYVGHASILVRLNGKKFLFDPVFERPPYLESWVFYPSQILDKRLLEVDAVIVSHCHQDHFDTDFLKHLYPTTKIYIVGGRPEFSAMLKAEGLRFREIPVKTKFDLGNGIEIYGVLHEYNTTDSSTIIKNSNFSVYHGNDNYVTKDTLSPMREVMGGVDVGCVPFSFIHWYPFLLMGVDESWKQSEAKRLIEKYLDLGIEQAEALDAKIVIPFGANLVYHDDANSVMNQSVLSPIDFVEYAKQKLGERDSSRYKPMFAGDLILKPKNGAIRIVCKERSKSEFVNNLQTHLLEKKKYSKIDLKTKLDLELTKDFSWLEEKLSSKNTEHLDHDIRIESNDGRTTLKIEIKLADRTVKVVKNWQADRPYHYFKVEPVALVPWLKEEISFEEIIGTRRFIIERLPNEYNLKILEILNNAL